MFARVHGGSGFDCSGIVMQRQTRYSYSCYSLSLVVFFFLVTNGFWVQDSGSRVGSGFRVQDSGFSFRVQGSGST